MDNDLEEKEFDESASEEKLKEQVEAWIKESQTYHDYLLGRQAVSEQYYFGNQTNKDEIPSYLVDTVENRIFEGVETLVPITSANAHEFIIFPGSEEETSQLRAESLQKVLSKKYLTELVQQKLEEATRHMLLFRFGVLKWGWNKIKDDVEVKVIDPRLILIPKLRCDAHDLPYKIEIQEYSPEEIKDYFPKTDLEELKETERVSKGNSPVESKKTFEVFEVWTSDYVLWYSNKKILDHKPNPYFDFEGNEEGIFTNFLDDPRDPFIFLTAFEKGDEPVAKAALVEIAIPIQDTINFQKRQICNNLKQMGNGQIVMDSDAMSKEQAEGITNETGLVIMGEGLASQNKMKREPGVQLPSAHFANLQDSKQAFDNVFGMHPATRGGGAAKTLGQDIMSRQQDLTRIDTITRVVNRAVQRLAEGFVQLMKMFYTENHVVKILGEDGAVEFVKLNSNDIEKSIEIDVRTGANPTMDKMQEATQAIQLWQLGALAPRDLYKRLNLANPEKLEQNLLSYKMGQLSMETQAHMQEAEAGAQVKASASGEGEGRKTETSQNVIQRAREQLGGGAPTVGKPKEK